ncbi:MAG: MFS transporter [Actinomycetota bacterium]
MTNRRVVRTYYLIAGLYTLSASLIWGVNTLFLLHAGLDIAGVFVANASYTAAMVLFEIPTGIVADTRGRRLSFLCSVVVLLTATVAYVGVPAVGGGLLLFCLASVGLGLGYTFYSGAVEAWLVDALTATRYEGELDRVFAGGQIVTGAAMLVGTVGGGFLGTVDLAIPFLVRAGFLVPVFAIAFVAMHDIGFAPRPLEFSTVASEMRGVARASLVYGWRQSRVRLVVMVSFLQYGFLTWAFYAWQPYFLDLLGRNLVWVSGVISALIALSTMAGNGLVEFFTRFCGRRTTLLLWGAAVITGAGVSVGLVRSFWVAVPTFLLVTGAMGVVGPVKQAYLHQLIPTEQRATIVSLDAMFGDGGSVVGQTSLGYLSRARSIADGYLFGGLASALAIPVLIVLRRLGGDADVIVGSAGTQGTCAAHGLPSVAAVDTSGHAAAATA